MDELLGLLSSVLAPAVPTQLQMPSLQQAPTMLLQSEYIDEESFGRVDKVVNKLTECIHVTANEPSLGLYRVDEHVRRSVSMLTERKKELKAACLRVEGMMYDINYTQQVTEGLRQLTVFSDVHRQLLYAIRLKGEIDRRGGRAHTTIETMAEFHVKDQELQAPDTVQTGTAAATTAAQDGGDDDDSTEDVGRTLGVQMPMQPPPPTQFQPQGFVRSSRTGKSSEANTGSNTPAVGSGNSEMRSRSNSTSGLDIGYYINPATSAPTASDDATGIDDAIDGGNDAAAPGQQSEYPGVYSLAPGSKSKRKIKKKTTVAAAALASKSKDGDIKFKSFD